MIDMNPWNNPSTLPSSEIPSPAVEQARALASDRLQRIEALEDAVRFALSKLDRRTSVAKRLEDALFHKIEQPRPVER